MAQGSAMATRTAQLEVKWGQRALPEAGDLADLKRCVLHFVCAGCKLPLSTPVLLDGLRQAFRHHGEA